MPKTLTFVDTPEPIRTPGADTFKSVRIADPFSQGVEAEDVIRVEDTLFAPVVRGFQNLKQAGNVYQALTGLQDLGGAAADIAEAERTKLKFARDIETENQLRRIGQEETLGGALGAALGSPSAVFSTVFESLPTSLPSLGLAGLGGLSALTPAAPAAPFLIGAGAGLGSGGVEFPTAVMEFAREHGVNPLDASEMEDFFADPEVSAEATKFATARAAGVGALDTISGGTAGHIFKPLRGVTRGGKALRTAGEAGAQAVAGGAGEALAQKLSGQEFAPGDIAMEALAEIFLGGPEIALGVATSPQRSSAKTNTVVELDEQQLAALQQQPTDKPVKINPIETPQDIDAVEQPKAEPLSEEVDQDIRNGNATVGSVFKKIGATAKQGTLFGQIAKTLGRISGKAKGKGVKIIVDDTILEEEQGSNNLAVYFPGGTTRTGSSPVIVMSEKGMENGTVIHEAIHAVTHQSIPEALRSGSGLVGERYIRTLQTAVKNQNLPTEVRDIISVYLQAREALGATVDTANNQETNIASGGQNALVNMDEFIAELFTNTSFQKQLVGIKVDSRQNAFQKIVNAVRRLIGAENIDGTLLEQSIVAGAKFIQKQELAGKDFDLDTTRQRGDKPTVREVTEAQEDIAARKDRKVSEAQEAEVKREKQVEEAKEKGEEPATAPKPRSEKLQQKVETKEQQIEKVMVEKGVSRSRAKKIIDSRGGKKLGRPDEGKLKEDEYYHGTSAESFGEFQDSERLLGRDAFFFSKSKQEAEGAARRSSKRRGGKPRVFIVKLKIDKVLSNRNDVTGQGNEALKVGSETIVFDPKQITMLEGTSEDVGVETPSKKLASPVSFPVKPSDKPTVAKVDKVYSDPTLRPHEAITLPPVKLASPDVKEGALNNSDAKGEENLGTKYNPKKDLKDGDEMIQVRQEINQSKRRFREIAGEVPSYAKDGIALMGMGIAHAVFPITIVMSMLQKSINKTGSSISSGIMKRYVNIVDNAVTGKSLQRKVQTLSQSIASRLDRVLQSNKLLVNQEVTMKQNEKDALRESIFTGKEIIGRKDLNAVANVIRKIYTTLRDNLNAAKKEAYQSRIDGKINEIASLRGRKYANIFRRIQESLWTIGAAENKASDAMLELRRKIGDDIEQLAQIREGQKGVKSHAEEKAARDFYAKAQPIGFIENYFPRRFRSQEIQGNQADFVKRATKMYAEINPIVLKGLLNELAVMEQENEKADQAFRKGKKKKRELHIADIEKEIKAVESRTPEQQAHDLMEKLIVDQSSSLDNDTPSLQLTRTRKLPNEVVEKHLSEYMDTDPIAIVNDYIAQVSRASELIRNFGNNTEFIDDDMKAMLLDNVPRPKVAEFFRNVMMATGVMRSKSNLPSALESALSWFNGVTLLTLLTRAPFSALAEPLNIGIVTGSAKASLKGVTGTMAAMMKTPKSKQWASLAESLGIIASGFDMITFTNRFNDTFDSPKLQKLLQRGFKISGMSALDRASRISATQGGHSFLVASARAHLDSETKGSIDLSRFGIAKEDMTAFSKWLLGLDVMPTSEAITDSDFKQSYTEAVASFVDVAIQNPKASDKPFMSNNPVGKIIFGLMSFSFAYQRNILGLIGKRVIAAMRGEINGNKLTAKDRLQMATMSILPIFTTYAGVAAISMIRESIADEDRLEELLDNGQFWQLAASRAGFFGAPDVLLQAWSGLKYRRDLTNSIVGPSTGYTFQALGDITRGLQAITKDESTKRSNEKIIEGLYKLTVAPAVVAGSALLPSSKFLDPAFGVFNALATTAPGVRRSLSESVVKELR